MPPGTRLVMAFGAMSATLFESSSNRSPELAVLFYATDDDRAIHRIDANLHFNAAVDAALLIAHFAPDAHDTEAKVYSCLSNAKVKSCIGFEDGLLLADLAAYRRWKHLCGEAVIKWRSGIKHDCCKVMELSREGKKYRNGLGELVELEEMYIYPMLKS